MNKNTTSLILTFVVISFAATGCDLISPKKPVKKAAVAPSEKVENTVPTTDAPLEKNTLAAVGNWSITIDEFTQRLEGIKKAIPEFETTSPDAKKMVLDELIRQQLLVQEAKQEKLDDSKEIKDAVKDFENTLLVQELVANLTKDVKATEQEAKEYYNANPDQFVKPVEKKLSEIVVSTETEAKEVLVLVLQGADFAQTAKERSKGKSAAQGGDLGFIVQAPFEQMQKAIETLNKGSTSAVFQGPEGFYIVKVEDVKGGDKVPFEDIKEDLVKGLSGQKQQQIILEKLTDIAKKVNVKVNTDLIEKTGE